MKQAVWYLSQLYRDVQTTASLVRTVLTITGTIAKLVRVNTAMTCTLELTKETLPRPSLTCKTTFTTTAPALMYKSLVNCLTASMAKSTVEVIKSRFQLQKQQRRNKNKNAN